MKMVSWRSQSQNLYGEPSKTSGSATLTLVGVAVVVDILANASTRSSASLLSGRGVGGSEKSRWKGRCCEMSGELCDPREEVSSSESSVCALKSSIVGMRASVSSTSYVNFVKVISSPLVVEAN